MSLRGEHTGNYKSNNLKIWLLIWWQCSLLNISSILLKNTYIARASLEQVTDTIVLLWDMNKEKAIITLIPLIPITKLNSGKTRVCSAKDSNEWREREREREREHPMISLINIQKPALVPFENKNPLTKRMLFNCYAEWNKKISVPIYPSRYQKDEAAAKKVVSVYNALNLQIVRNKAKNPKYHNM